MREKIIIDAANSVLGRVASFAAKQALLGKEVIVVNCKDILITGNPKTTISEFSQARRRGRGSQKGPIIPKVAFKFTKRVIRGMLPHFQTRGKDALKRIICYDNSPEEYQKEKKISLSKELKTKSIKLSELIKII
ncbi:MAG: 50S ribosomal protein L13 [Candidatus Pacearchaeota archaeon]|nr:50S ribosomal protein L13 [Candidatus Pacearchaeota archaeon]